MALIADSGAIYAVYDADDRHHAAVVAVLQEDPGPVVVPAATLAEIDYLLREYLGVDAELQFLEGILQGCYLLAPLLEPDLIRCRELIAQYRDLKLGLADASVIAAAERFRTHRILTLDERDFRAVRPRAGGAFTLLPADAPA
jgi:predicted nucleic acid-binding protein